MTTKNNVGVLSAAVLKWAAVPLLAFFLAGSVTKSLVAAKRGVDGEQLQETVAASLKKLDSGDRAGALDGLARAGNMAPSNVAVQTGLIGKFQALGEHKLAAEAIERALRAMPKERQTARSYAGLCEYLLNHGDLENAKRVLAGDLVARWPDALETAYLRGRVALVAAPGKDDLLAAERQLQDCLSLNPEHVPSKLWLGVAYARLGKLDQAEALLREAWEKKPLDPSVLEHLGSLLHQQGKATEAALVLDESRRVQELQHRREQLESQFVLKQLQPADQLELGRVYVQLGEFAQAARTLRAYTRRQPGDADAQRELAQVCLRIDDQEGARVATELADALEFARRP
ncbi:MAG: tetratricopeptide repeat protein [Planctomycetota bacterium]|jgi:Tfp pilus assembly protein PilF